MSQVLDTLRQDAGERFASLGWPNRRVEAYKYTDLSGLKQADFGAVATRSAQNLSALNAIPGLAITTASQASAELQAKIGSLLPQDDAIAAYSTAHLEDVTVLQIAANTKVEQPLVLEHSRSANSTSFPRYLVILERGAEAELIERYAGDGDGLTSPVVEVFVEDGAHLTHYRTLSEAATTTHLGWTAAEVGRDATYRHVALNVGGELARHNIRVTLAGTGSHVDLLGLHLLQGKQSCDSHTYIKHAAPHTTSNEVYKSVVADAANSIFQGKIFVAKDSQKIEGNQMSRGLLLGPRARVNNKPELEIYADDVICSHGSTVGALDEAALFYLRARGIPAAKAKQIMVEAFINEVLDDLGEVPELETHWQPLIDAYLGSVFSSASNA